MAVGVSDIAALRARSLDGRVGLDVGASEVVVRFGKTGLVFWASRSEILMLCLSGSLDRAASYWPVCLGGLLLLISGDLPAIDVSGIFALRGGGGAGSSVRGRYSVAVDSLRLPVSCVRQRRHIGVYGFR